MSSLTIRARLLTLLQGDEALYRQLCESGILPHDEDALVPEHLETARVARTLLRELEVNWAGVEVVMRMRAELLDTRRQMFELLRLLRERESTRSR
jgi:hypothetical protein